MKISAFVINFNGINTVEACLTSLAFADELIVIDKSSTDGSDEICKKYATNYFQIPWSPTVEPSRQIALECCQYDTIIFLDGDEILSVGAIEFVLMTVKSDNFDIIELPFKNYILGQFSPSAYYWPSKHARVFKRNALVFRGKVHGGIEYNKGNIIQPSFDSDSFVYHLSHADTKTWVEKTNRYTEQEDRAHTYNITMDLVEYAEDRLTFWSEKLKSESTQYDKAVMLLRYMYDIVDSVKLFESYELENRSEKFRNISMELIVTLEEFYKNRT